MVYFSLLTVQLTITRLARKNRTGQVHANAGVIMNDNEGIRILIGFVLGIVFGLVTFTLGYYTSLGR